ncbi:cation:proton antiporter [Actinomyces sp. W5033]|uniref:cation:proton antiporter n=1 Tax=Actinomyces sp. W5033 TaxID=3446479 RepID=UPI003EE0DB43
MTPVLLTVIGLLVIAACNQLAPRVGVASPLILLALGIGIGFLPWVDAIEVDPELILQVVLPPLLFAAAVSMPVMDFRRELRSVAGLAVGLVVISAVALGLVVHALVPALSLPWAIALGAVLSPTDAVAVAITRSSGVGQRIITVLEGEGLFNDATALVLLSSAVSAALATDADALRPAVLAGELALALAVALLVGWVVGEITIRLRARVTEATADTVISFTVPFVASVPAEHLGGSGLVAAVVAGLVVSFRGPRLLSPAHRRAAQLNWHTIELVLEGAIFLVMGLQAYGIVHEVTVSGPSGGPLLALAVAAVCGALTVLLRAAFVAPLLVWLRSARRRTARRLDQRTDRARQFEDRLAHACDIDEEVLAARNLTQADWQRALGLWRRRLDKGRRRNRRTANDLAYFTASSLGPREAAVIVWAGMRGAVTLAAAQTLPLSAPARPFLLLVALVVAAGSLIIQGLTLGPLISLVGPRMAADVDDSQERRRLLRLLGNVVKDTALARVMQGEEPVGEAPATSALALGGSLPVPPAKARDLAVEAIHAQRAALLDARDEGLFTSATLEAALARLDDEEIMLTAHH